MKSCKHCQHAAWDLAKGGRLHPSGDGRCTYQVKIPQLPQAMYWFMNQPPSIVGGLINRRTELKEHCAYYMPSTVK